jgi:hypothetical protein
MLKKLTLLNKIGKFYVKGGDVMCNTVKNSEDQYFVPQNSDDEEYSESSSSEETSTQKIEG